VIFGLAIGIIFIADRTGFWLKGQKQFNPWTFGFLLLSSLGVGLLTVKRGDKDLGFLNRDQTDEWKGWMQGTSLQAQVFVYTHSRLSRNSYISLHGGIQDFWDLQPYSCACRSIFVHDWLWTHNLLHQES